MRNSNRKESSRKARKDFPLSIHKGTGYWCKKVKGRVYYFGKVSDDPDCIAAAEQWEKEKDDLKAGRLPREKDPDALTVADLVNEFLTHQEERMDKGEIAARTFQSLHATCANIVKALGKNRAVMDLTPNDFGKLKSKLSKSRKAVALRNEMQRCKSIFRYGYVNGLVDSAPKYGTKFDKPNLKQVRKGKREHRQKYGDRMFEAEEILQILSEAKQPLRAMVLLAINCGMGQSDLANLPLSSVDLEAGLIDFPRPKTEADRICPLWEETVQSIREWIPQRPKSNKRDDRDLLFVTRFGNKFVKTGKGGVPIDGVGQEFSKLLKELKLERPGRAFYALRHSFRTVADEILDPPAINLIMGHTDNSMSGFYRERIGEDRLRRVVDHVHDWVFSDEVEPNDEHQEQSNSEIDTNENSEQNFSNDDRPMLRIVG